MRAGAEVHRQRPPVTGQTSGSYRAEERDPGYVSWFDASSDGTRLKADVLNNFVIAVYEIRAG